jgi:hypothetical protein
VPEHSVGKERCTRFARHAPWVSSACVAAWVRKQFGGSGFRHVSFGR